MKVEVYHPTSYLEPFIKEYRIIESDMDLLNRVLPNTSLTLAFRFKGQVSYVQDDTKVSLPFTVFSGLRKSVRLINYAPNTATLIVLFKEAGASAFIKQPLHELFEESIGLENFISAEQTDSIEYQLAKAESNQKRINIVEQFLLSKIVKPKSDLLINNAISRIYNLKGIIRVKELAADMGLSQDAFEKRFRKTIGTTPKQFAYIVRMNVLIRNKQDNSSLLDMAFDAGFYDQPHFNKDFKLFTGQTPTDFYKSNLYW